MIGKTICFMVLTSGSVWGGTVSLKSIVSEFDYPRYAFNYAINDPMTKDNKAQWEARDGDVVNGAYSLLEPDGSIRVVEYTANDIKGFNAIVKKIGPGIHPVTVLTKSSAGTVPIIPLAPIDIGALVNIPFGVPAIETTSPLKPIRTKLNYGFGPAPLAIGLPKVTTLGHRSLPWDPVTGSYGGWVPLNGPVSRGAHATIISKKYTNGKIYQWSSSPFSLEGKKIVIKKKQ